MVETTPNSNATAPPSETNAPAAPESTEINDPNKIEPFVMELLDDIAREEGFINYTIEPSAGSNHGDGFMGIMLRVLIKGERIVDKITRKQDELSLMLKMPPKNKARREQFHSSVLFERESYMYDIFIPAIVEFQREKGIVRGDQLTESKGFFGFPKVYRSYSEPTEDRYAIIMENLKEQGYDMFDKYKEINIEHVKFIMTELGKLHGISFALAEQKPEIFEPFKELNDVFGDNMIKSNPDAMLKFQAMAYDQVISGLDVDDEAELREKLENIKSNYIKHMDDCMERSRFNVIGHGDCWNNNMMYLYEKGSNNPKKICLIDFQLSRYGSTVLDLTYFIFTSTLKPLRDQEYKNMIDIYYNSLADMVRALGSDPEQLFTRENLNEEFRRVGKFGALITPMILQVITAEADQIPDMDDIAQKIQDAGVDGAPEPEMMIKGDSEIKFKKRAGDAMRDMNTYGLLEL